jgi:hypothetical protein
MRYSAHRLAWTRLDWLAAVLLAAAPVSFAAAQASSQTPATSAPGPSDAVNTAQPARWAQRKINFVYLGFTTHYSCEGLTDKVRRVLLELGARKSDMHVHEAGCTARAGEPVPFPGVQGTFSVLEPVAPAEASSASGAEGIVAAHWQPVNIRFDRSEDSLSMSGQCELLEQVQQHILPLIPARNAQLRSLCIPHQLTAGGNSLQVEVLMPDKTGTSHTRNSRVTAEGASALVAREPAHRE